ncbi:MAG: NAD-dependent epimerase/dehydratase family protein [Cytophagales bacterium]|nr:NAD-dependent epimerase/dehydratase family protein [Bernardetiaceae bacterium]MDW8204302.1 NAD-dependent epimerase/dehydratase family protein [Cytophagales bacterium]
MLNATPKVFMTGASGFVGSYMARRFLQAGIPVTALYRNHYGMLPENLPGLTWIKGDLADVPLLTELTAQADWVIHAAGLVSFAPADRQLLFKINVEGTANIVNACLATAVKRFCFVSSVAALGGKQEIIDEQARWDNSLPYSAYALTKHLAEREVWRGIAEGLPAFIVNPSVVLGRTAPNTPLAKLLRVAAQSPIYPPGVINLVDAGDVAEGVFRLFQHPKAIGERFICNATAVSYRYFFEQLAKAMNIPIKKRAVSSFWLKWMGTVGEWLGSPFNKYTAYAACQTHRYNGNKLVKFTHLCYRNVEESIWEAASAIQQFKR